MSEQRDVASNGRERFFRNLDFFTAFIEWRDL